MKISVRLWQTALFVTVILVAMFILASMLFIALEASILDVNRTELKKTAQELSQILSPYLPDSAETRPYLHDRVVSFVDIFESDAWVYDTRGKLIEKQQKVPDRHQPLLAEARDAVMRGQDQYATTRFGTPTAFIAAASVYRDGNRVGIVVVANEGAEPLKIRDAARNELKITFWLALVISGLLGFVFSEIITRQVKRMSDAALAIAGGDFEQRLPKGRLPDEIADLAESFNRMAAQLGQAFSAIRGQEREIAAVVEAMAEGVVAVDGSRIVRLANPVAARLLGIDPSRFTGRHVDDVIRGEELLAPIDEALSGNQIAETIEFGHRILLLHATPIVLTEGTGGAVLLIMDITEQKLWEQAQREFIQNASHEMRTPIAAMRGFLELLEGGAKDKPEIRDEFLRTMQAEVDRLQRLVADLFTLAQLDSGRVRLEVTPQRLEEIIGDVVAVMGPLADEAGAHLETELQPEGLTVLCDRDRTVQVLIGFVDNALKHSPKDATITVWAEPRGSKVAVGVRDTGPGIPAAALGKIFDRFYRVSGEASAARYGAGLGLAIAKEIVEAHGSSIQVDSEPGAGADFYFALERAA